MTEFKVGDRATHHTYGEVEITYGPFRGGFYPVAFLGRTASGVERIVRTESLTLVPKFAVGDDVEYTNGCSILGTLVAGPFTSEHHDEPIWVMEKANGTHMTPTENVLRRPEDAKTFVYGGVSYEMGAVYRDREGDHFDFKAERSGPGTPDGQNDGTPQGRYRGPYADSKPNGWAWSLGEVVGHHGPLTKVDV
ncbi:phiSA1p31-related protein [Streptomyces sp. CA-135486]|uniref:phiSA1p31-related protein n=1 Tax=Streptomyces sp. CA-135486 TaxID=3240049 RepID=UPI003D906C32